MLDQIYQNEKTAMLGSLAVHQSFKEKGIMQDISKLTEAQFDAAPVSVSAHEAFLQDTLATRRAAKLDIVGATEAKEVSGETLATLLGAKEQLGLGDEVTLDEMVEATKTPIKPLTKKQQKQQKYMMKNLQKQMTQYQRKGQAQHIMAKLFGHSIRTPEQARQVHATQRAREELTSLLGVRQADAFFAAGPDVKCHDFFPKATIEANPKLMTDLQGQSRTLSQVYEYFIYKHVMLLLAKDDAKLEIPLETEVDWSNIEVPGYVPYAGTEPTAPEAPVEVKSADWDHEEFGVGSHVKLNTVQIDRFEENIHIQAAAEGREVSEGTIRYIAELREKAKHEEAQTTPTEAEETSSEV